MNLHAHAHTHHEDHVPTPTPTHAHAHPQPQPPAGAALKDPVCGMTVTEQSPHHTEHDGRPYTFCSAKCLAKFSADPAKYLQPAAAAAPPAPAVADAAPGTIYSCPMQFSKETTSFFWGSSLRYTWAGQIVVQGPSWQRSWHTSALLMVMCPWSSAL